MTRRSKPKLEFKPELCEAIVTPVLIEPKAPRLSVACTKHVDGRTVFEWRLDDELIGPPTGERMDRADLIAPPSRADDRRFRRG
jgi:hypothetical protein